MDYKELLKKYMRHVMDCEGVSFVGNYGPYYSDVEFTEEEKAALQRVEEEVSR